MIDARQLVSLMVAYQQASNASKTIDTANRVLQANPNDVRALALLAYYYRSLAAQGGADAAKNADLSTQYGQKGLNALSNTPKPEGMSSADFTNFRSQLTAIFDGAVGFAALQKKDMALAQRDLREAVQNGSQPNISDIYPLATADLEANPVNPEGFWFAIKASQLAQGSGQQQILEYARKKYIRYHGSEDGWNELVNLAKSAPSIMPPAGFLVAAAPPPPPVSVQAAQIVSTKAPNQMSFAEWQLVLSSGNAQAANTVWNAISGKTVRLAAYVLAATPLQVDLAGNADDIDTKTADITLRMLQPLTAAALPQVGKVVTFQGKISSYNSSPFRMTFTSDGGQWGIAGQTMSQQGGTVGASAQPLPDSGASQNTNVLSDSPSIAPSMQGAVQGSGQSSSLGRFTHGMGQCTHSEYQPGRLWIVNSCNTAVAVMFTSDSGNFWGETDVGAGDRTMVSTMGMGYDPRKDGKVYLFTCPKGSQPVAPDGNVWLSRSYKGEYVCRQ